MHVVVWRNKPDLDSMSIDYLYNNLKVNAANSTNIDNLGDAIICAFLVSQSNNGHVDNESQKIFEETGRKLNLNGDETVAIDKTKVECYNFHKRGQFARECKAPRAQDNRNRESTRRNVPVKTTNSSALVSYDGLGDYDWSDKDKEGPNYVHMAYSTSSFDLRYHVTILNTIDHLGKFDGKADEGFFVRYSLNSKAYRVFNSRTRILENTHNNVGSRLNWLFEIDALTRTMNYQPVVVGIQSSGNADDGFKPSNDVGKKVNEVPRQENECKDQKEEDNVNSTNRVNDVSSTVNVASNEVNDVGRKSSIKLPDDLNMPELEDISIFEYSNKDVFSAEADLNNLESTFQVSPIPTIRIHKDCPL
uniref:Ribonuclease H-like domain-containing protein n=1 Tax=Tanacetum cinerariifolium TaxID=118510 RepID=A0A6L2LAV6_TANCI|nr:ribonuclease H-like domain-containing protein [Tanacetum cinerariifolium]